MQSGRREDGRAARTSPGPGAGLSLHHARTASPTRRPRGEGATVISLVGLVVKLIKWIVIAVAYLLVGLAKVVTIVVVLLFLTGRAGVRRLANAKARSDGAAEEEYDLGYPSHVGRSMPSLHGVSRDAFDARWQRERDLRVAERRERRVKASSPRMVTGRSEAEHHP